MAKVLIGMLVLVGVIFVVLVATGSFKKGDSGDSGDDGVTHVTQPSPKEEYPYINPKPFKVGYLKDSPQKLADVCNTVRYPVQPVYVDYGTWDRGGDCCSGKCDNLKFNAPP